jgi:hypothetical protein
MKPTFNTFGGSDRRKREEFLGNAIGAHVSCPFSHDSRVQVGVMEW